MLFGILGAIIPIIIHLINKKKAISHKFAAIDFILQTNKRISVKIQTSPTNPFNPQGIPACLPCYGTCQTVYKKLYRWNARKDVPTSNVIIVDDSYSMQYSDNHESFFMSAKTAAMEIINNLTKNDDAAVITCSSLGSQVLPELDYDKKIF